MQTGKGRQHPPDNSYRRHAWRNSDSDQRTFVLPSWVHSPLFGYSATFLLIGVVLLVVKVNLLFPHVPLFLGAPFALVSVLVGLLWGLGPALFSIVLGLIGIALFLSPDIFTFDLGKDIILDGPFVVLQLIAVAIVIRVEAARRRLHAYAEELKIANQRLEEVNEQLERANSLKDYVITRSSHELRTPMTTILGRAQLVLSRLNRSEEKSESSSKLRKHLEIIEARALHLRALIDELFDLSSVHSGELPLRLTLCDLGSLCRDVVEDQRTLSDRSIELELPSSPLLIQADEKRLWQVLVNLVSNAVKYSPKQSIIHVRVHAELAHAIIQVNNEGSMLTQEQSEHLFEPFYRTLDAEHSPIQGWGLGLSISKEIVERHGGQIGAESAEGKGITFFVKLPFGPMLPHKKEAYSKVDLAPLPHPLRD